MKSVGLKTIAFELNVSVNTVSRALRDCDDISDETKLKVRQKAYELGYMPNNISQFIKRDGKNLISVVVNSFNNLYFNIICEKLISLFKEKNYDFSLVYTHEQFLTTNVIKQCISQRTDAIITMLEPNNDAVDVAKLNNIPIVMVGRIVDNDYVDEVYTDDTLGGTLAANYLVNFHRCNKLIYVKNSEMECCQRRQDSFVKTVNELLPNKSDVKILSVEELDNKLNSFFKKLSFVHIRSRKQIKHKSDNRNEIQNQKPCPRRLWFFSLKENNDNGKKHIDVN